jgi:hypothetical protein
MDGHSIQAVRNTGGHHSHDQGTRSVHDPQIRPHCCGQIPDSVTQYSSTHAVCTYASTAAAGMNEHAWTGMKKNG